MSSINQKEVSNLAEELRTITAHAQVLLSKIAMKDQDTRAGDTSEPKYPHDYEPLPINRLFDVGTQKMHHAQRPYIGLQVQDNIQAHSSATSELPYVKSHIQKSGYNPGFVHNGTQTPSIRPHVTLNQLSEYKNTGCLYQNTRQDPSGIYYCPYTFNNPRYADQNEPNDFNSFFNEPSSMNEATCIAPSFIHHRDSVNHSCMTYKANSLKLTPQEALENNSVHTATTFKCSFGFESGYTNNNQDMTSHFTSKASSENDMDEVFNSNEWNLEALYGLPTMDEFQEYYTADNLPNYAVVLGSTISSHNSRAASRAYRKARGANNTALSVVFERLLSHFRDEGVATYENKFPQHTNQLLFVRVVESSDPKNTLVKFKSLFDRSTRDEIVLADIRSNGNRSKVDILKTMIDQKRRDLDALCPAPQMCTKHIFTNHLNSIRKLIDTEIHDELSLMQFKLSIETMWDQFFTLDKCPKKRGRPKKDCSVVINGKVCGSVILPQSTFNITKKLLTGKNIVLPVEPTDTVAAVKAKLSLKEGIPTRDQILITNRVRMDDKHTVDWYNATSKSVVHLVLRLRGYGDTEFVHYDGNGLLKGGCLTSKNDNSHTSSFHAEGARTNACISEMAANVDQFIGKEVGFDDGNFSHVALSCVLPNNQIFAPSVNGRAGRSYANIYELKHELGRGAFGAVYMATHRIATPDSVPWKEVAIKHFRPNQLDLRDGHDIRTYDDVEQRCAEIKILIHLRQGAAETSNVLYLYEYFMDGKDVFAVTELLDQDLDTWRQECEGFTEQMAIDICRSIMKSLKFISERNVVHRDIKPQNILFRSVCDFKTLKLVDFGLSRILGEHEQAREFCGSVGYIAPEVYANQSYRFEVDMFAFGVLLFRLLSGKSPFPRASSQIIRRHTLEYRYNLSGTEWEKVSDMAKDLVQKLLTNRQERLTANEALEHPWCSSPESAMKTRMDKTGSCSRVECRSVMPTPHRVQKPNDVSLIERQNIVRSRGKNDGHGVWSSIVHRFQNRGTVRGKDTSIDAAVMSTPSSFDGSTNGRDSPVGNARRLAIPLVSIVQSPSTQLSRHRRGNQYGESMLHTTKGSF